MNAGAASADPLTTWSEQLGAWAIPAPIMAAAPVSPWVLPPGVFARRVDRALAGEDSPSVRAARAALGSPGSVLDVGAGTGAAVLAVATEAASVTAVDEQDELLEVFRRRAAKAGIDHRVVVGRWPDVAPQVEAHDVVVCHHVLYNVADLAPFVQALTAHARRRVVVELTARHPLTGLNALWWRFHRIRRPTGPTADDAIAVVRHLGHHVEATRWRRPAGRDYDSFGDLVAVTRQRLCLTPDRDEEVAAALRELGGADPCADVGRASRDLVTLTWPGSATPLARAATR